MTVSVVIPNSMVENKVKGRQANADKYGCQPYSDLFMWLCFTDEVEAWIEENCKRKSGIRLRENPGPPSYVEMGRTRGAWSPPMAKYGYIVYFTNEKDGMLFKMRWIGA